MFVGRPATGQTIEEWVLQFAQENRSWGYRRIVGALSNLGYEISHQTVANVLKRHGLAPAPQRGKQTLWKDFIRSLILGDLGSRRFLHGRSMGGERIDDLLRASIHADRAQTGLYRRFHTFA